MLDQTDDASDATADELSEAEALRVITAILSAEGTPPGHAAVVAEHLTEASVQRVHSHGVMRVGQYVDEIRGGELEPASSPVVTRDDGSRLVMDGRRGFGQVSGVEAARRAVDLAAHSGIGCVHVTRAGHSGRIGAYVEAVAEAGHVGLAVSAGPRSGHRVVPFGGLEGRLATNPIAFAYPSGSGPVVADFATSATSEGFVRNARDNAETLPPYFIRDAAGEWTRDPNALYADPPGAIQPLGGDVSGHKGYALGIFVELLASLVIGEDPADPARQGSTLTVIAIRGDDNLADLGARYGEYIRSSPPRDAQRPVLLPGDRERAARSDSVTIDAPTAARLRALTREHGIPWRDGMA
jgi:hydroxycarboxylate dehydrogenase B